MYFSRFDSAIQYNIAHSQKRRFVGVYSYCSSEYYLGTVPFQADPKASTLRVEIVSTSGSTGNENRSYTVDIKKRAFSTPEHVAFALSQEIKRKVEKLHDARMPGIKFGYKRGESRFWFSIEKSTGTQDFHLRLGKDDPTSILPKLGFSNDMTTESGSQVYAENLWTIGDGDQHGGRSIHDQRIRSDVWFDDLRMAFDNLRKEFEINHGGKKKRNAKKRAEDTQDNAAAPQYEYLLLAEYLFSLVFLSMYRTREPKDGPTMKIDATRKVADGDADDFGRKLDQVCNFGAEDSAPVIEAMDVVKTVRLSRGLQPSLYSTLVEMYIVCVQQGSHLLGTIY